MRELKINHCVLRIPKNFSVCLAFALLLWELKNRGLTIFVFQRHELPNLKVHKDNQIEVHVCISRFTLQFCKILDQLQLLFFNSSKYNIFFTFEKLRLFLISVFYSFWTLFWFHDTIFDKAKNVNSMKTWYVGTLQSIFWWDFKFRISILRLLRNWGTANY